MKRKLLFFFIIVELALILFLAQDIYKKYSVSKQASVSIIERETIAFPGGGLKYFYEPLAVSDSIYTINSDTLNDGSEYQTQKPENTYRIVVMGDSVTFGLYVNTKDSYPEVLERLLNNASCRNTFEVINLGMRGYDIRYTLERYKLRGAKYNPDLAIWFVQQGNFSKIQELIQEKVNAQYKTGSPEENAVRAQADIISVVGEKNIVEYQSSFLKDFAKLHKKEFVMYSFKDGLWGEPEGQVRNFTEKYPLGHFYKTALDLKKNGALFPDAHPNKKGYLLMAQDLFDYLWQNNIIPC